MLPTSNNAVYINHCWKPLLRVKILCINYKRLISHHYQEQHLKKNSDGVFLGSLANSTCVRTRALWMTVSNSIKALRVQRQMARKFIYTLQ